MGPGAGNARFASRWIEQQLVFNRPISSRGAKLKPQGQTVLSSMAVGLDAHPKYQPSQWDVSITLWDPNERATHFL